MKPNLYIEVEIKMPVTRKNAWSSVAAYSEVVTYFQLLSSASRDLKPLPCMRHPSTYGGASLNTTQSL